VTMLLLNHNFGLLAWIGVPLTVWMMWRGGLSAPVHRLTVIAITVALTWTVIAAALWDQLPLVPRYFLLPGLLLSMLTGIALVRLWRNGGRRLAVVLGALLVGVNLLSMWVDNRNYMSGRYRVTRDRPDTHRSADLPPGRAAAGMEGNRGPRHYNSPWTGGPVLPESRALRRPSGKRLDRGRTAWTATDNRPDSGIASIAGRRGTAGPVR